MIETVKIKPSHASQGEFVEINKDDFNPDQHELLEEVQNNNKSLQRKKIVHGG